MAKAVVNIDDLVKQTLLKIATADAPMKLSGAGGLFATLSKANKEAIVRLKDESQPLVVENGSGKTLTVALTLAGFERVADAIPEEKFVTVVSSLASSLGSSARVAFLQELVRKTPQVITGIVPLLEASVATEKSEADSRAKEAEKQRKAEEASRTALKKWLQILDERKQHRIESLKQELLAEGVEAEVPVSTRRMEPARAAPAPTSAPSNSEEIDFRRNVARRLVSSWVDAWDANKPDAREFLESAIWNVSGFRPVGEAGQWLNFDGRYHEGPAGLFTGDHVEIVRPGWVLEEEDDREYVILKAQVTK